MTPHSPRHRASHDRWLISYADFITLLFAFFVVLFAFAKADERKQRQVAMAIDAGFRSLQALPPETPREGMLSPDLQGNSSTNLAVTTLELQSPARVRDDLEQMRIELQSRLVKQTARHIVSIQMGRDGLVISLREAGFFDSGSAVPLSEASATLRQVAQSVAHTPYSVRVEGHTDDQPIRNAAFASNWELSTARATAIVKLLLRLNILSPERLSAAGYAEFHPVASNAIAAGRANNRRVDLVILPRIQVDFSTPPKTVTRGNWARITDP